MLEQVRKEAHAAAQQICEAAKLRQGQILVVGCSTSEVTGHKVGSYSSPELGQAIYEGMQEVLIPRGIYLAAQCCEHLNRAIIAPLPRPPTMGSGILWRWSKSRRTRAWTLEGPSSGCI